MELKTAQRILASRKYYTTSIDGEYGPATARAIDAALSKLPVSPDWDSWPLQRQWIAAAQAVLREMDLYAGEIDGYAGNQTNGAILEWEHFVAYGKRLIFKDTVKVSKHPSLQFPTQAECAEFYGKPGKEITGQMIVVKSPYPLRISYATHLIRKTLNLHRKCADAFVGAMETVTNHYTAKEITELGLDLFGGDYVHRLMRGGTSWSMHAYACATDFDPDHNGLTTRAPTARFSKLEYADYMNAMESTGLISLGRAINRDYMHFQAARLK